LSLTGCLGFGEILMLVKLSLESGSEFNAEILTSPGLGEILISVKLTLKVVQNMTKDLYQRNFH
jgi:hypothetical protein